MIKSPPRGLGVIGRPNQRAGMVWNTLPEDQ